MAGPEPGWYPDPEDADLARYWDGVAWTADVHRMDAIAPPPAADPIGPPPPPVQAAPQRPPAVVTTSATSSTPLVLVLVAVGVVIAGALGVLATVSSTSVTIGDPAVEADRETAPQPSPDVEARLVDPGAPAAAGCTEVDPGDGSDRSHMELGAAPDAEDLYDVPLPAWGPHTPQVLPELGLPDEPLDVRVLLHNLEHGAVAVWLDPAAVGNDARGDIEAWMHELRANGFRSDAGSHILVSPAPADADVAPISLRAWGAAIDCPSWDGAAADAFVAEHYGTRGEAPEAALGPYPEGGLLLGP